MKWEDAETAWAMLQVKAHGDDPAKIRGVDISFSGGGEVQIGDMTWDYESPEISISITYWNADQEQAGIWLTYNDMPTLLAEFVSVATTGKLPES